MGFRKILVIKLRSLGDTVLMTAPLAEVRTAYPNSEIHVLVLSKWESLFSSNSEVAKVWSYERHPYVASRAKALARLALKLRHERYDCVINLHASPSSAMLAFSTGAKTRSIHFHGHHHRNRHTTVDIPGKGAIKPIIERDMDTVRALGVAVPEGRMPRLELTQIEVNKAQDLFARLALKKPVLGIGLGASRPTKKWPIERFAQLAISWCQYQNGSAFAIAGPGEETEVHQFLKNVEDLLSSSVHDAPERAKIRAQITATHTLNLRGLAGALSQLSVFATNDSGPKHLAVALKVPTVTFFGPEDPYEWHPYPVDKHPYFFIKNLNCRRDALPGFPPWCGLNICIEQQHTCMRLIGVDDALSECRKVSITR